MSNELSLAILQIYRPYGGRVGPLARLRTQLLELVRGTGFGQVGYLIAPSVDWKSRADAHWRVTQAAKGI